MLLAISVAVCFPFRFGRILTLCVLQVVQHVVCTRIEVTQLSCVAVVLLVAVCFPFRFGCILMLCVLQVVRHVVCTQIEVTQLSCCTFVHLHSRHTCLATQHVHFTKL